MNPAERVKGSASTTASGRTIALAFVTDAVLVLAFTAFGRSSHAREASVAGFFATAWPFLAALVLIWVVALIWKRPLALLRSGLPVWLGTAGLGLLLRGVTGGGLALPFVIVTVAALGAFLLGWRAIAALVRALRRR